MIDPSILEVMVMIFTSVEAAKKYLNVKGEWLTVCSVLFGVFYNCQTTGFWDLEQVIEGAIYGMMLSLFVKGWDRRNMKAVKKFVESLPKK